MLGHYFRFFLRSTHTEAGLLLRLLEGGVVVSCAICFDVARSECFNESVRSANSRIFNEGYPRQLGHL